MLPRFPLCGIWTRISLYSVFIVGYFIKFFYRPKALSVPSYRTMFEREFGNVRKSMSTHINFSRSLVHGPLSILVHCIGIFLTAHFPSRDHAERGYESKREERLKTPPLVPVSAARSAPIGSARLAASRGSVHRSQSRA